MDRPPSTIVVVEDDQDTLEFLLDFFAMLGVIVVSCPPTGDVLACIVQSDAKGVILDVYLGGITGVDVLHHLRATPTTQTVPIVFFSGSREKLIELLPDYALHGAVFVPKPDIMRLKEVIEAFVHTPT